MKKVWGTSMAAALVAASLWSGAHAALADGGSPAAASVAYALSDRLALEVKAVLNERVQDGTRIGVIVTITNKSAAITRIPENGELRVRTADGVQYTLQPGAGNVKAVQPKSSSELSYMTIVDRTDELTLTEVDWTEVDYYVYPKQETTIVSAPITVQPWKGGDTELTAPEALKKWSESFVIPSKTSPIQYTPVEIHKESTPEGTVQVVRLLAYNPGTQRETVPDFTLDGKSDSKVFAGKRVESGTLTLEGKEEKYIHYAIPTEQDTVLRSLNLLTPENFGGGGASAGQSGADQGSAVYSVGRLNIALPAEGGSASFTPYVYGTAMAFDSRSTLISANLDVSLVEFQQYDDEEEGAKHVYAKFKIKNTSDKPLAIPVFQTDLVSPDGYEYSGTRQTLAGTSVLPNSSVTVNYAYKLPIAEKASNFGLKLSDAMTAAPYKTTIATYSAQLQPVSEDDHFSIYPFDLKITHWDISGMFNRTGTLGYSYKAKFFMELKREEQVQLDPNFSHLQFELYDSVNRLIGTSTANFTGPNRLVTGENNILFSGTTEQFDRPLVIRVFEVFTAGSSESKRLLAEFKQ